MNFFQHQDKAKRQTRLLVGLFALAVIAILAAINLVFWLAVSWQSVEPVSLASWLNQPYWLYISGAVLLIIAASSLFRSWQLRASPDAIAKMVNASPIQLDSTEPLEQRLVNVVEEMSIASGMAIPKIYVMQQETGINAFVSGLSPAETTLVVTRGLLENLNRDELQGVIAHEYSHIFHGDMQLNVRLMGIVAGILVIGQLGQFVLRGSHFRGGSSRKKGGNAAVIMLVGVGLLVVGYIGLFFGRLIKAAISRQREFLADASAVQYTRNKQGIAGALFKIRQLQHGSLLDNSKAEEMSHMCFGAAVSQSLSGWLATHPPLEERIVAISPHLARQLSQARADKSQPVQAERSANSAASGFASFSGASHPEMSPVDQLIDGGVSAEIHPDQTPVKMDSSQLLMAGELKDNQVEKAQMVLNSLPSGLKAMASGQPNHQACYLLAVAMLMQSQADGGADNPKIVGSPLIEDAQLTSVQAALVKLTVEQQHALLAILLARISQLDPQENEALAALLANLYQGHQQASLSEFMIYASLLKRCLPPAKTTRSITSFARVGAEVILFLDYLYRQSGLTNTQIQSALAQDLRSLGIKLAAEKTEGDIEQLNQALKQLSRLSPLLKQSLLDKALLIAIKDGRISQKEYELIRLLAEYFACPLPILTA